MKRAYWTLRRLIGNSILDFYGRRDAERFCRIFPDISDYEMQSEQYRNILQPYYEEYTRDISTPAMAISLEAAVFLYILTTKKRPRWILDLGSGFSSFTFRLYSMNTSNEVGIYSVDDDQQWLEKTRSYLTDRGVRSDNLLHWRDFQKLNVTQFDLIFHDLGYPNVRAESLPFVLSLLDRGGILVLDDMHKSHYRANVRRVLSTRQFKLFSMRAYTLDKFGRFSSAAISPVT